MAHDEETSFLNADLDIYAVKPLDSLVAAFGKKVTVLFIGRERRRYSAHLELSRSGYGQSADTIIAGLVAIVQKFPRSVRAEWNGASARQFNIGVQAQKRPLAFELPLKAKTVAAIASVGGEIIVTIYAPETIRVARKP